jgi:type VI secretion system protein ImpG
VLGLGPEAVATSGLEKGSGLLPWPAHVPEGLARVQEYFTLPQKLLFLELRGLEPVTGRLAEKFEIVFRFDRPLPLASRLPPDAVRLFCVPVVNLFAASADPLRQELPGQEHLLRAGGVDPLHQEVFSVDAVTGLRGTERTTYRPFSAFTHLDPRESAPRFFKLRRAVSPLGGGADTLLSLGSPREVAPPEGQETLSVDLTCTHRLLAGRLGLGEIYRTPPTLPAGVKPKNIAPVTQPVPAALGSALHWRMLSHLGLTHQALGDPERLRHLLALYNAQERVDQAVARGNNLRLEAISAVEATPARRLLRGAPVRGVRTQVSLDETRFASPGDALLFGAVLDALHASFTAVNGFSAVSVLLSPSQRVYDWPARSGERSLS